MCNKIFRIAILAGLAVLSGVSAATGSVYTGNPERNALAQASPAFKSRADVAHELADFRKNPISQNRWQYVGGEREWARVPHTYAYVGGKFEHTEICDHTSGPVAVTSIQDPSLYKNAF